ncbi:MAG: UTP--glucose-1-phosphate uridylyltransferase [Candidatus Solibacter sp.]|nr:UTP--glucose-1-phosphate uridylyltransferase [Candidatus Solibacter sp.]
MDRLIAIITSDDEALRNTPLDRAVEGLTLDHLLQACRALDSFRRQTSNLYHRVRALFFLSSIHRYSLPRLGSVPAFGHIPFRAYTQFLDRRFEESISILLDADSADGPSEALSSALAAAYRGLAFQTLADQVRRSVRSISGNQWMFRCGHAADYPLRIRQELLHSSSGRFPILRETTPVRMDLSHSAWSDIFFLGMDYPEGARVLNISIDLAITGRGQPKPPVEAHFRVIDRPVIRLVSVDLNAHVELSAVAEVFDFAKDYLGLLKAAVIASGIVPPGMEGAPASLAPLLERLTGHPGHGIEIVSKVNDIPKGSRLAVSTNLLACLIAACMRATGQVSTLTGAMEEDDRRLVAARAILGEWLGGSGGGWQDSGGVWPGVKLIRGVQAQPADPEFGISRGCLLPRHDLLPDDRVPPAARQLLQDSLVLVHGGMAQDVGPILEMVTEKYLLRSAREWQARGEAVGILDQVLDRLAHADIRGIGSLTQRNFDAPIQTIIPWAGNHYTQLLINRARAEFGSRFWGFWMLGGMAGGGMGFLFDPEIKPQAATRIQHILSETKRELEGGVPFAMEPVVYDFRINPRGSWSELVPAAEALMPPAYYVLTAPALLRRESRSLTPAQRADLEHFGARSREGGEWAAAGATLIDHLLPETAQSKSASSSLDALLESHGFDRVQHSQIRADMKSGRIGLAQNRLPASARITNVDPGELPGIDGVHSRFVSIGQDALAQGSIAAVSLAGGAGSRWTRGAGVVKALNPFCKIAGRHRSFVEIHLAKSRKASRPYPLAIPHVFTTSYMTHRPFEASLARESSFGYQGPLLLSPGRSVGLRFIPMTRDLRFAWEETPQQVLDVQKQKVIESLRAGLIQWALAAGEGSDYRDNLPLQCLHPTGHWYELPNMLRNGVLARLLDERPSLKTLLLHNIDTLGADVDPGLLGFHLDSGAAMTVEVIPRLLDDRGGGLARVDGRIRLVEGLALPGERIEFDLSFYNSGTMWIDIDRMLAAFPLTRAQLRDQAAVDAAVRDLAARMPSYVTIKDVKKRWGRGQEDIFPVAQFEKLWGDMTALPELDCRYLSVPRLRGQQLKDVAQLDGWVRDGSAAHVASLCDWQ